jgi:hypothetical protein
MEYCSHPLPSPRSTTASGHLLSPAIGRCYICMERVPPEELRLSCCTAARHEACEWQWQLSHISHWRYAWRSQLEATASSEPHVHVTVPEHVSVTSEGSNGSDTIVHVPHEIGQGYPGSVTTWSDYSGGFTWLDQGMHTRRDSSGSEERGGVEMIPLSPHNDTHQPREDSRNVTTTTNGNVDNSPRLFWFNRWWSPWRGNAETATDANIGAPEGGDEQVQAQDAAVAPVPHIVWKQIVDLPCPVCKKAWRSFDVDDIALTSLLPPNVNLAQAAAENQSQRLVPVVEYGDLPLLDRAAMGWYLPLLAGLFFGSIDSQTQLTEAQQRRMQEALGTNEQSELECMCCSARCWKIVLLGCIPLIVLVGFITALVIFS